MGCGLPQIRPMQLRIHHGHVGPNHPEKPSPSTQPEKAIAMMQARLRQDASGAFEYPSDRLFTVFANTVSATSGNGGRSGRESLAHDRRYPGRLSQHVADRFLTGGTGEVCGARPLERSRHAGDWQWRYDARPISYSDELVGDVGCTAACGNDLSK